MVKVITYGTYDLLHYGHIQLLKRAKALGDYLIVGITSDMFDRERGKINVQQSLMERIEAVRATGLADELIVEEYEGQKIDDIKRFGVDIFTVGSDWKGNFDYLNDYCQVIYLERTKGISSTELRSEQKTIKIGLVGESPILNKIASEISYVNGLELGPVFSLDKSQLMPTLREHGISMDSFEELLECVDALYMISNPHKHASQIKTALEKGVHVLCESPITLNVEEWNTLSQLAKDNHLVLMDGIKTAYSTAYYRLLLLAKGGVIGSIISVDATCTSLVNLNMAQDVYHNGWNSIYSWGPTALLPIFQLLGTDYKSYDLITRYLDDTHTDDSFTKMSFVYPHAVASVKVGQGVKSEGELVISGEKGYIYVPAPWWKTDYFEVRFEDPKENKRYFYQLDGEGLRYELLSFLRAIRTQKDSSYVTPSVTEQITKIMEDFNKKRHIKII